MKTETTKKLWYAVNGSGQGCLFTTYPTRNEHFKIWRGEMISSYIRTVMQMESEGEAFRLPAIRWEDEPVQLSLTLEIDNQTQ